MICFFCGLAGQILESGRLAIAGLRHFLVAIQQVAHAGTQLLNRPLRIGWVLLGIKDLWIPEDS